MAFDFKKEQKSLYAPKTHPEIVEVPKIKYIAVRGKGNPNSETGLYKDAIAALYTIAYTLKMSYKTDYRIEDFFEYVVPPLEGFWWQEDTGTASNDQRLNFHCTREIDYKNKDKFHWISVIRVPDFVQEKDLAWAKEEAVRKKKADCSLVELIEIEEGLCVQIMHIGSYDNEPASMAKMNEYLNENGFVKELSEERRHHEIYLSDPRRVSEDRLKTVIRLPIAKK